MSERINGFTITLEHNIKEEQMEAISNALKMIKGVIHVHPNIVTPEDHFAEKRIKYELFNKLVKIIE